MRGERECRILSSVLAVTIVLVGNGTLAATTTPRAVIVAPFDASGLAADDQWMGEGVAQILSLGLAQHPAFVQIDRFRLGHAKEVWTEALVHQAAHDVHASVVLYGRVSRAGAQLVLQPLLLDLDAGQSMTLMPITMADADLLTSVATLPAVYARALQVPLTPAETARIEKAARPTASLRSFELFARGKAAFYASANEDAVDLLLGSIKADPPFAVAQYALGTVHQVLGVRWKAAAQFRAATMIDPTFPEPFKALGDLFLTAPRKLHDAAGEAYSKAIGLRPFYADAYVGLGRAREAQGDLDAARTAYERAVTFDPFNSAAFAELGRIYATKGRCADSIKAYQRALELDPHAQGPGEACGGARF